MSQSVQSTESNKYIETKFLRPLDFFISIIAIILISPILLLIALLIKVNEPSGKIFFLQKRLGQYGVEFTIFKFRTMNTSACNEVNANWAVKNDTRITRIGRILRKHHLDELPQLINIMLGDMSFVGPRPFRKLVHDKISLLNDKWDARLVFKPGLTGYAQVYGEKGVTLSDHSKKLILDLKTVNLNVYQYIKLIFLTFIALTSKESH